jgi:hypothetical protein
MSASLKMRLPPIRVSGSGAPDRNAARRLSRETPNRFAASPIDNISILRSSCKLNNEPSDVRGSLFKMHDARGDRNWGKLENLLRDYNMPSFNGLYAL